jgi:hypothetical protein
VIGVGLSEAGRRTAVRGGVLALVVAVAVGAMDSSAWASGGAVVPIAAAEGKVRGLPSATPGRFASPGSTLAQVGDVNGDGIADVAMAAPSLDVGARRDAGVVYVLFGGSALGRVDVGSAAGFRILGPRQGVRRPSPVFEPDGPPRGAMAGVAVAGAGDINGDGLADVLVGAPFAGNRKRAFSGSAYVIFGKRTPEPVDLARLGSRGFRIDGPRRDAAAGYAVAGPGDVNGDGRGDLLVSAGIVQRAAVYVVLGKAGSTSVDLGRLGRQGFRIRGGRRLLDVGAAISGAGDFNGDGIADMAIGAPQSGTADRDGSGFTFVVFGGALRGTIELDKPGTHGVLIRGEHEFANFGESLASLGDINGDGRGDLLVGASQVSAEGRSYAGAAYVLFGRPAGDVDLRSPAGAADRILGPSAGDGQARAGVAVAAVPDVNADGRTDMLIGAPGAGRGCSPDEGAAYVVFSPSAPAPLDLGNLGTAGYAITGGRPEAGAGSGVAAAGDWNGDGRGDALVLQHRFGSEGPPRAPRLDLVLGRTPAVPPAPTAEQFPRIEFAQPTLRRLAGRRGLDATVTVNSAGPADSVLVEIRTSAFGEDMPIAAGYAHVGKPGPITLKVTAPGVFRPALRRRTHLPARVVVSQCTTSGHELEVTGDLDLRRSSSRKRLEVRPALHVVQAKRVEQQTIAP